LKKSGLEEFNLVPNGESRNDVYFSIIKEGWELLKAERFAEL
jgi:hypothetical protein